MRIGYSRQNDNYRHSDGSYSIWGPSKTIINSDNNNQGSMWLTTFVVKAFAQASKYIDIESQKMQRSIDWILNKQSRKSGCFDAVGQLIHSSLAGPEQSLTASVLVSIWCNGPVGNRSLCLQADVDTLCRIIDDDALSSC